MFGKILFIFVGLFVQEIVTLNALIFATNQGLYSPILIHFLFLAGTFFDIFIGFYFGKYIKKRTSHTKFTNYVDKIANKFSLIGDKYKRWFSLFLLGNFSFPYINSCIAGYLDMPLWESSFFIFSGNLIYYISIWLLVYGISTFIHNVYYAFLVIIGVAVLFLLWSIKKQTKI